MKQINPTQNELQEIKEISYELFREYIDKIADFDGHYLNSPENEFDSLNKEQKDFVLKLIENYKDTEDYNRAKKTIANYLVHRGRVDQLKDDECDFISTVIEGLKNEEIIDNTKEILSHYLLYISHYGTYDNQDISRLKSFLKIIAGIEDDKQIDGIAKSFEAYIQSKDNINYDEQGLSKTAIAITSLLALSGLGRIITNSFQESPITNLDNNNLKLAGNNNSLFNSEAPNIVTKNIYDTLYNMMPSVPDLNPFQGIMVGASKVKTKEASNFLNNRLMRAAISGSLGKQLENNKRLIELIDQNSKVEEVEDFIKENHINLKTDNFDKILLDAFQKNKFELIKVLIKNGANVNSKNQHGRTILMFAMDAGNKNSDLAQFLINNKAKLDLQSVEGLTAAMWATNLSNYNPIKLLLKEGSNPDIQDNSGTTILMNLVSSHISPETVEFLIKNKANLNLQNRDGQTALMLALGSGRIKEAKLLIENGADLHLEDKDKRTAIKIAKLGDRNEIIQFIENKFDQDNKDLITLIDQKNSNPKEIENFIKDKHINFNSIFFYKALPNAIKNKPKLAKLLIENGVDYNLSSIIRDGKAVLNWVIEEAGKRVEAKDNITAELYNDIGELIINHPNTNLDLENNGGSSDGATALMTAVGERNTKIIDLLISKGANLNIRSDKNGFSALFIAIQTNNQDAVAKLIKNGANPYIADRDGKDTSKLIAGNLLSDIAKNNEAFLKLIDTNHSKKQINDFVTKTPVNFYIKDKEGKTPIYHLYQKYSDDKQEEIVQILKAAIKDEKKIEELLENEQRETKDEGYVKYLYTALLILGTLIAASVGKKWHDDNKRKKEELEKTLEYLGDANFLKSSLKEGENYDLLKITQESLEIKFESNDPILKESFGELFKNKEDNPSNKNGKKTSKEEHNKFLVKNITNDDLFKEYLARYLKQINDKLIKEDAEELAKKIFPKIQKDDLKTIILFSCNNKLINSNAGKDARVALESAKANLNKIILQNLEETKKSYESKKEDKSVPKNSQIITDSKKTEGEGNCLIHALVGTYNSSGDSIITSNPLPVREELTRYVKSNLNELISHSPNSTKTPIALSILDHFLITAKTEKSSDEAAYYKNNSSKFEQYENQELIRDILISDAIEDDKIVKSIYDSIMRSVDLCKKLSEISGWDEERIYKSIDNDLDKSVILKYVLKNPTLRAYLDYNTNSGLDNPELDLNDSDKQLNEKTKEVLTSVLSYYAKNNIWLTSDFAEIYAKKNGLNVIIHTGANEERVSKFLYNQNNLDEIIYIGIRNGEKGNHFEKIDNLELWLTEENDKQKEKEAKFNNNYSLVEKTATKISDQFLSDYKLLSTKEKKEFYDICVGDEANSNLLQGYLKSKYENENQLPHYLWEGIANELFYGLISETNSGFAIHSKLINVVDLMAISFAGNDPELTVSSIGFINKFTKNLTKFSHNDLINADNDLQKNAKKDIKEAKDFAAYTAHLVTNNYKKEFTSKFWARYQDLELYKNALKLNKKEANKQYFIYHNNWLEGKYELADENGKQIIAPNFEQWKINIIDNLIHNVPYYIISAIDPKEAKNNFEKINQGSKNKIKNLKLQKLSQKDFVILLSYTLTTDVDSKEFMLKKIKESMSSPEDQEAFSSKVELMNNLITKEGIKPLDIIYYFQSGYQNKDKNKNKTNVDDLSISYTIKKSAETMDQKYVAENKDIIVPSRRNDNNIRIVFTKDLKEQLQKQVENIEDWEKVADNGFVGSNGQQGIKTIIHDGNQKLYELKSLGNDGNKRCYAILKEGVLFVVGYEDQKGQQQKHIEKYSKYEIEVDKTNNKQEPNKSMRGTEISKVKPNLHNVIN